MYAARPKILDATGRDTLSDEYFTQHSKREDRLLLDNL